MYLYKFYLYYFVFCMTNCNIYKIKNKDQKRKNGGEWCDVGWNGGHIIKK